jgi:octaprenyl-diphosphate synthase
MPLDSIRSLVLSDLEATDKFISTELQSDIPLINELIQYILNCGGKRIRPLLVLLSSRAFSHEKSQHVTLAAAIELIHTATLLHDDVVDNSSLRRGHETAHSIWGNEASVLVGDFLYSRAFQLIVRLQNLQVMNIFADATNLIAEGEILQLVNCKDPETTEASYYDVIQRKTGKLFEVSSQLGPAISGVCSVAEFNAMQSYGMNLGIAYQLIDDALDYSASAEQMGKNMGTDLAEGKPTLPLIHALRHGTPAEVKLIRHAIEKGSCDQLDSILGIIESTKAIEYTADAAKKHAREANLALNHVPDSPFRKALHDLAEFVVERGY